MNTELPVAGTIFVEKYQLDAVLGEGGFARVYRATDLTVGRSVAIKVLKPTAADKQSRTAARFLREMRVIASLTGPHVVRMFDFGRTDDGLMFMVFELLGGEDLEALMSRGPMPEEDVVHVMRQVLEALKEAHSLGLLHRDIKPGNIRVFSYMNDPRRVKLLDFGIAKSTHGDASLTATGKVVGTPGFMAPEQLYGEPLSASTDLYSLALVALEALTGRKTEHIRALSNEEPVGLTPEDGVSEPLSQVINTMLSREPDGRFGSADAALRALSRRGAQKASTPKASRPPTEAREATEATEAREARRRGRQGRTRVRLASSVPPQRSAASWCWAWSASGRCAERPISRPSLRDGSRSRTR